MSDSILKKYKGKAADNGSASGLGDEVETVDDLGAFGWLRGMRDRALMLELRKKDGNVLAFGYYMLEKVGFDPSDDVTLHFASQTVKLSGRNLGGEARPGVRLLQGIMRHRVPWIKEADEAIIMQASNSAVIVERIEW